MSRNTSKAGIGQTLCAPFILFTRLPLWRLTEVPQECYSRAVVFWPLVGWLTGGVAALTVFLASLVFPLYVAVLLALTARTLLTGALHEDGLADFCDAFGCGGGRERVLAIMKDSHIGTYGVISLILWFLLASAALSSLTPLTASLAILSADPFAKGCASRVTGMPYARPEGSKNRISYARMPAGDLLMNILFAVIPSAGLIALTGLWMTAAWVLPVGVLLLMMWMMRRTIGGYTGDCCGATFLACELSLLLAYTAIWGIGS